MRCESLSRAGRRIVPVLLALATLQGAPGRAAAPTKADSARKGFDFRRPDEGEILPNPPSGVGSPPRLMEFSPAANAEEAGDVTEGGRPPPAGPPVPAGSPTELHPDAGTASGPPSAPAQPAPPETVPPASSLRTRFAAAVAQVGIGSGPSYQPSPGAAADPAARAVEERAWDRLAESLAASRAAWDAAHPRRAIAADAIRSTIEPGHVTLLQAPARVTGAFDDPGP